MARIDVSTTHPGWTKAGPKALKVRLTLSKHFVGPPLWLWLASGSSNALWGLPQNLLDGGTAFVTELRAPLANLTQIFQRKVIFVQERGLPASRRSLTCSIMSIKASRWLKKKWLLETGFVRANAKTQILSRAVKIPETRNRKVREMP
jgi:hypothetical protein